MSSAVSIRELKQNAGPVPMHEILHVQLETCREKTTKTGNPFYELRFADAEESLIIRVWDNSPMFPTCAQLKSKTFYELKGEFGLGNDGKSVDAKKWEVRALEEHETEMVLAGSEELRRKQAEDYQFIETTIAGVSDPRLKALGSKFLADFGPRFRRTGAARDYHHARRGGLVEHVAQMMRSAVQICVAYKNLNRDLLVTGVLFHDVGKLWENAYVEKGFTMPYTEVSELIGHIPMGMEIVNKLWREVTEDAALSEGWDRLEPGNGRVRLHLLHLIASHHGELAFGSPLVPKTPEAQALHYIDNLDAKMEMFDRGYLVAPELAKNVYERVRPLPGKLVEPLARFEGDGEAVVEQSFGGEDDSIPAASDEVAVPEEAPGEGAVEASDGLPIPPPSDEDGNDPDFRPDPF